MAKHRKLRGRKLKKQRGIIIVSVLALTFLLSTGYAAFSTNISLSAKGNIKEKPTTEVGGLKINLQESADTSDGLYKDTTEDPVNGKYRYIYKGTDPDNYITFNGDTAGWRIVSIESDGAIKIVKVKGLSSIAWDKTSNRNESTDTYCTLASSYGCKVWAKTSDIASLNSILQTQLSSGVFHQYGTNGGTSGTDYSGTITKDASLNTFLNGDYYTNTLKSNKNIEKHNFNISTPGDNADEDDIGTNVEQEKLYTWNGYVGLITTTDYIKVSTDSSCTTLYAATHSPFPCKNNNYLFDDSSGYWTISPYGDSSRFRVYYVTSVGNLNYDWASSTRYANVRPTLFLKSDITLKGEGTSEKPYYIDES